MPKRVPPHKKNGQAQTPRRFDGEVMDVHSTAQDFFGGSEATVWSRKRRGMIPFRKYGGRVVFLRSELEQFFAQLPGVSVDEAIENIEARES